MSSYDQAVIAEFRARGGIIAGRRRGLSLLLLHPGWCHNLVAHPVTTARSVRTPGSVRARVAAPDERRRLIAGIAARTLSVAATVTTTKRSIPVVILDLLEQIP
jgi:F420H(2)-dependent quinone reductase